MQKHVWSKRRWGSFLSLNKTNGKWENEQILWEDIIIKKRCVVQQNSYLLYMEDGKISEMILIEELIFCLPSVWMEWMILDGGKKRNLVNGWILLSWSIWQSPPMSIFFLPSILLGIFCLNHRIYYFVFLFCLCT